MADNNENNPLNDAVEQVETGNDGTEQQQAQQNQQNTIATTIATGADAADAADDINQAMEDNPSGAGAPSEGDDSSGAQFSEAVDSEAASSEGAQSGVVDSQMADEGASADAGSGGAGGAGAGAQSVGGQDSQGSDGGSDAEGQTQQASGAPQASAASPAAGAGEGDDFDTQTDSETFEVNVLDEGEQANLDQERLDDDFDSETTEQTFEIQVEDVNDEVEVEDVAYTIQEDGSLTFTDAQLLAGATDVDGDDLTVANVTYTGADGVFTDNGDGTYTFSPNENFNGEVDLSFSVSDGTTTTEANIDVTVEAVNDLPVAGSTTYSVNEDGIITISDDQLLANSSDVEGDVSVSDVSYSGTDGIFTDNGDGTYSFAPNENFNGNVSLDVVVVDEDGATAETTAGIDVIAVNDAPVSGDLAYSVDEDGSITLTQEQLLSQASDVDGDDLTAANLSVGDSATVTANEDGSFTITPDADFNGDIDLNFDISDGTDTIVANADLTVNPVNDAAVVEDVGYTIQEDGSLTFTDEQLLAGASDIDGDDLSVADVSYSGTEGVFTDNGDGTYTFSPNENFNGEVDLSFSVSDGTTTTEANIDVTVESVNDIPVAGSTTYSVDEDGIITISDDQLLANSSDIEGGVAVDDVSYSGTDGIFTDNGDGTYSFAPNENFNGNVSLDVVVVDEDGATAETTAGIDVIAVNDAPVSGDLAYSVDEDGSITLTQEQLLSQASDVDGDDLTAANLSAGDNATVTANEDGSFTITPDADFNGDIDLSFDISDGTDTIVANADLTVNPVNDAAVVENVGYTIQEDGSLTFTDEQLLAGASDIDGDDLSVADVSYSGTEGVFTDNGDGTYTFAPNENFNGEVDLSFSVSDGTTTTESNIDVTVESVNDIPVAGSTTYSVQEDNSITITDEQLLANSSDVEGDVSVQDVSYSGTDGVFADNGDGTYTFSPNENFSGEVSFDVVVADEDGATEETSAGLTVIEVNDPPIAGPTSYTIDEESVLTFSESQVLANASDIEGDVSLVGISYDGPDGIFSVNGDGTCSFAPNENFNGEVQLNVTIQDEDGATVDTVINVDVLPINDAPVSGDLAYSVDEDGSVTLSQEQLLSQASDVEGDELTAANLSAGDNATVTANEDGSFTITPDADFNGDIDLSFDISDGTDTIVANADLTVNPVNDAAVVENVGYTIQEDGSLTFTDEQLLAGASDIDGDDLSVADVSYSGTEGVFTDNGDGTYTFAPNENFNGEVDLSFSVSDGTTTTEANIDVTVESVNDVPVAGSTTYSVDEDGIITISDDQLLANSSDIEGGVAVDDVSYSGTDGIFTDNGDGTYSFAPNENFNGNVSLDVTVVDEEGATADTTAGIDVIAVNDAPVSGDLAYSVDEDGSITLTQEQLLSQANDVEGDELTAANLSAGDNATVTANEDGSFTITPDADFNGDIDLNFDISDGTDTIVANADLSVNPVNDLPTTSDVYANVDEDNTITITQEQLLANAADIEGDALTADSLVADNATIIDNGDGTFSITPNENFNGYIDVAYSISDGDTPIAANLGLTVDPVNDAPIVSADVAITIEEDGSYTITQEELLQFATDIEDDDMTAIIGEQGDDTTVTGTVLDAETSNPVSGADVTLADGAGNSYTTVTDDSGNYSVSGSIVNEGTVTIEQEGAITTSFVVPAGEETNGGVTAISEVLDDADMRVVVTWGDEPRDLDNHLWLYNQDSGQELDHIYYRDMSYNQGGGDRVSQDVDDVNGNGPETITIPNYEDMNMHYSVHNYSGRSWDVDGVEEVQVQIFVGDSLIQSFTPDLPDNPQGDHWHVFDIVDGVIVPSQDVSTVTNFELPTSEEASAADNGIDISEVIAGDTEETGSGEETDGNEPSIGDIAIENAIITDNGDGTYTITPEENFNGEFSISYNVDDGNGGVTPAELDVTVTAVNDLSVIYDHDYTINEDGSLTFTDEQLLAGATDIDGDDLTVESVNYEGADGVFTDNGDGTYTFAPNENFNGNVDLTYDVSDGTDTVSANIDVQVVPINDVPVAGATSYSVNEDGSITISDAQLLANSSDVEGDVALDSVTYTGTDGVFTDNGDGTYTFSPNENFNGDVSLNVTVVDEDGATADTTAGIDVISVNDLPVAGATTYSVDEDNIITITSDQLLANSSDIEGEVAVEDVSYSGTDGILTDNGDGTFSFAPNENFNGNVSLDVTVVDEDGATADTTASIDVIAVNDAPVSGDLAYSVDEDGSITLSQEQLLSQASDVEGDDLEAANLTAGDNATVTANEDGSFTITPDADFNGDIDLSFDVSDGTDTIVANADLTVNPVNDAAVVEDVGYTIQEDGSLTFTDEQLLAGASDIDGDDLSVADVSYPGTEGVFTDNGDGTYTFAPNENFNGNVDLSFSVSDGTTTTEANIDVTVESVNDIPVAGSTTYSVDEDGIITISDDQLLANSSDVEGEVSVSDVSYSGTDGIFTDNGDGTYSFAPNENFNGDVSLDVIVADEDGATVGTTAGIEVIAVNDAPVSGDLAYSVDEDGSITLTQEQLLAQAGDTDGDELTASNVTAGDNATVSDNGDGSFTITPDANFNGDIDLNFDISDGTETIVANADLTVNPVNDAATSDPVDLEGIEDNAIIISQEDLLKHAQDIDGDDLTARDLSIDESFGSLVDNTDGTWTFTPTENYNGDVPFNFNVDDGTELTPVQGNIDIAAVNDEPQAPAIEMQGEEDQVMVIDPEYILAQASDLDGDELTLESISVKSPQNAQLQQQPDGMYHLVTSQDFNGLVELAYEITDGEATAEGSLNVDVIPVNDAPFNDGNAFLTTNEDGAFTFDSSDMLDLFGDIDTENLVISRIIMPDGEDAGDLNDNGDGTWTFTPTGDFAGTSGLQVVASDGEFETALDVPVFVRPVADGAVITTDHEGPLVFSEDSTGHLGLNVDLIDDSEMLSNLVMTGFPVGFEVSDGENTVIITEPGQMISITNWNIDDLQLTPPEDFSGNFFVTVSATTVDYGDEPLPEPEGSEIAGDFDTTLGEPIILTEEDLIGMAQNIDANDDDAIQMVHLVDPSQGAMVDNGDGTWTFSPADGFTGEVDFAYVVERDGILHDEQSTIGVHENEGQITDGPEIESIASATVEESEPLNFTDSDMLGTLSSETGEMNIESVTLLEGEGLIESDGQGGYQFTPAEGYTGSAQIGFVASDGENSVESHFNITVDEQTSGTVEPLAQSDDGSIGISGEQVLQNLDVADDASLSELNYTGDEGALVPSGDDQWTFWPDPEFSGDIPLEATVQSGSEEQTLETTMNVETAPGEATAPSSELATAAADTETVQETVEATSTDETDTEDESADVTAAPGTDVNLSIPDEVTSTEGVEQVELSGIPEGASVSGALDNGDGTYTVSGDLSQPVTMSLGDTFEGEASISFQGVDELDTPIEGATATTTIEVDDQYAMQASSQAPTDTSGLQDAGGSGDWTSGDNTDTGVDFTDDSGSFGHDDQSSGGSQHDIDDNNF